MNKLFEEVLQEGKPNNDAIKIIKDAKSAISKLIRYCEENGLAHEGIYRSLLSFKENTLDSAFTRACNGRF